MVSPGSFCLLIYSFLIILVNLLGGIARNIYHFLLLTTVWNILLLDSANLPIVAFPWQHRTLLHYWQLYVRQKIWKRKVLLHCHCNNGHTHAPQCNGVLTLSTCYFRTPFVTITQILQHIKHGIWMRLWHAKWWRFN